MANTKRLFLRCVVFLLVYVGIAALWKYAEVELYGESQASLMDALATYIMTHFVDNAIWRKDNG